MNIKLEPINFNNPFSFKDFDMNRYKKSLSNVNKLRKMIMIGAALKCFIVTNPESNRATAENLLEVINNYREQEKQDILERLNRSNL
jgi:flagellar motor component MotA